jgi:hypothetical protein
MSARRGVVGTVVLRAAARLTVAATRHADSATLAYWAKEVTRRDRC